MGVFNADGCQIPWQDLSPTGLTEGGIADIMDRMSKACRFTVPAQLPPTSPETLIYRVMAGDSATQVFEKDPWEWRNGQLDTSGGDDQGYRDQWFEAFPGAKEAARVNSPHQPFGNPKYGFWFLLRKDKPMACPSKTSLCWDTDGNVINLAALYSPDRRIHRLVGTVLNILK